MATEKVGIEIELMSADTALATIQKIDNAVRDLGRKKTMIKLDDGSLVSVDERIKQIQDRLAALATAKKTGVISEKEVAEAKRLSAELKVIQRGVKDATSNARTFAQTFKSISSSVAHAGSAMQSFGNAMTNLTSPFTNVAKGMVMGAGYKVLNQFTSGLQSGFDRYDTMKKFPKIMQQLGYTASEAETAVNKLDDSVQGLPTSLDDMVDMTQRFTATTGDLTKGTDIAIAANNAFLASMSTETQRYQGMMQLQDVIGGKDMNAKEWQSLADSMLPAIRQMGEYLGLTGDELDEYVSKVQQGKIANEEFINTLIKAGTDTNGTIYKMAQEAKDTWEAFFSRVGTAASRMVYGVLTSLDEVSQQVTGMDVNQLLDEKFIPAIDNATESVKAWIKAHPEEITDFFNTLKEIDVASIVKGYAEAGLGLAQILKGLAKIFDGKDLSWFGKLMIYGNAIGKASTILGGLLKGTRHIGGFLAALGVKGVNKTGIFGKIMSLFGNKKDITAAGEMGKAVTKASPNLIKAFKNMALLGGIVSIPAVTGWVVTKGVKESIKNFKETVDTLKEVEWQDAAKVAAGMVVYLGASAGLGALLSTKGGMKAGANIVIGETIAGVITSIAAGFFALDMNWLRTGIENFTTAVNLLSQMPDIDNAGDIYDRVKNAIETYNKVAQLLNGDAPDVVTAQSVHGGMGKGIEGLGFFKSFDIKNLSSSLKALVQMSDSLNSLASVELPENAADNAAKVAETASQVANKIGSIGTGFGGVSNLGNAMSSWLIQSTMKNVVNELIELRRMAYHLNALSEVSVSANAMTNAAKVLGVVKLLTIKTGKIFGNLGNMTSSSMIKTTMKNVVDQIIQLRRMAYHINQLAGVDVNKSGFTSVINDIREALASLKDVEGDFELDITVKLNDDFQKSVDDVVSKIKKAKSDIKKQKTGIIMTIPVSVQFSVTTSALSKISSAVSGLNSARESAERGGWFPRWHSGGGMIYRAKGGSVPFKRRGSDTVPAMLTPGEFVHNKQAVNTFGIDFMRKVNNLDVRGAMSELMTRAGRMASIGHGTTINNTYNNNQQVVQHINTNSQGFTFKAASRFVGAI